MLNTYDITIKDLIAKQLVVPDWLRQVKEQYGEDQTIQAVERVTPWGTYLIAACPSINSVLETH